MTWAIVLLGPCSQKLQRRSSDDTLGTCTVRLGEIRLQPRERSLAPALAAPARQLRSRRAPRRALAGPHGRRPHRTRVRKLPIRPEPNGRVLPPRLLDRRCPRRRQVHSGLLLPGQGTGRPDERGGADARAGRSARASQGPSRSGGPVDPGTLVKGRTRVETRPRHSTGLRRRRSPRHPSHEGRPDHRLFRTRASSRH